MGLIVFYPKFYYDMSDAMRTTLNDYVFDEPYQRKDACIDIIENYHLLEASDMDTKERIIRTAFKSSPDIRNDADSSSDERYR